MTCRFAALPRLLSLSVLLVSGCSYFASRDMEVVTYPAWLHLRGTSAEPRTAELEAERVAALGHGQVLYRQACATCHGVRGDGKGPSAAALESEPWDFTSGYYLRSAPEGDSIEYDIFYTISSGVPGTAMVGFQDLLSQEDRWSLVEYLKKLSKL